MRSTDPVTPADAGVAAYLQSIELATADVYARVPALLGDIARSVAAKFQEHHTATAKALEQLAGSAAVHTPNPSLAGLLAARLQAATDEPAVLTFLFGLENQLAATYVWVGAGVTSPDLVHLVATVVPTAAARSAMLGSLGRLSTALLFPNGPVESSVAGDGTDVRLGFDPALFPVA